MDHIIKVNVKKELRTRKKKRTYYVWFWNPLLSWPLVLSRKSIRWKAAVRATSATSPTSRSPSWRCRRRPMAWRSRRRVLKRLKDWGKNMFDMFNNLDRLFNYNQTPYHSCIACLGGVLVYGGDRVPEWSNVYGVCMFSFFGKKTFKFSICPWGIFVRFLGRCKNSCPEANSYMPRISLTLVLIKHLSFVGLKPKREFKQVLGICMMCGWPVYILRHLGILPFATSTICRWQEMQSARLARWTISPRRRFEALWCWAPELLERLQSRSEGVGHDLNVGGCSDWKKCVCESHPFCKH